MMRDGIYQVKYRGICAGFVWKNGRLDACAPILLKRFSEWVYKAKLIKNL